MHANLEGEFNVIIISGLNDFFGEKKMFNAIWEAAANKVYVALIDTLATIITIIGDDDNNIKRKKWYSEIFLCLQVELLKSFLMIKYVL